MMVWDGNKVRVHAADNAGAGTTAEQLPWPRAPLVPGLLAGLRSHHCNTQGVGVQGIW